MSWAGKIKGGDIMLKGAICGGIIVLYKCKGCGKFKKDKNYKLAFDKILETMMALREVRPYVCKRCKEKGIKLTKRDKPYRFSVI